LGEAIILIPDWFQLYFIENKGAAFGMHIATPGTMDWGKLILGLFRIGMVVALIWLIRHFMRKKAPKGVLIGFGLILAGA
ncbi:signal peptidase II, partial [Alistipes finegoldii]|uniref:signal peptidase II n=2 Tax=Alistipes TaxID=239759 RepID=UPI00242EDE0F